MQGSARALSALAVATFLCVAGCGAPIAAAPAPPSRVAEPSSVASLPTLIEFYDDH